MIATVKNCTNAAALMAVLLFVGAAYAEDERSASAIVPRFMSLRSGEVNLRVGPGTRYSINWVYKREDLPVEVIQEFDQWREIRDAEGTTGWVHKQMLQSKRTASIRGDVAVLKRSPDAHTGAVVKAEAGVIGRLLECKKSWCQLQISGRKGWIEKKRIFGVYAKEEF
jgi:SH3-like domain-containing protein